MSSRTEFWAQAAAVSLLLLAGAAYAFVAFRFGLDHTPDSGLYLFSGAKGYLGNPFTATQSNYPPGFPMLISLGLVLLRIPGDAATLVQALSLLVVLFGSYASLRYAGGKRPFSVAAALLVGFFVSTSYVLSTQLTEGLLCGLYAALVGLWCVWSRTQRRGVLVALFVLAAFSPFVKYASAFVPGLVALFWSLHPASGPSLRRRAARFFGAVTAATLPIAGYMVWNRVREGVVTSHPPSRTGFFDNLETAASTVSDVWRGSPRFFLIGVLTLVCAVGLRTRAWRRLVGPEVGFCLLLAIGYFAAIIVGASLVHVDPLGMRLCAPGITLGALGIALLAARGLRLVDETYPGWPSHGVQLVMLGVALFGTRPALGESVLHPIALILKGQRTDATSAYHYGFRRSSSASGLNRFYAEALAEQPEISVTLLEAQRSVGRVRRSWMTIAGVLGGQVRRVRGIGKVRLAEITDETVRYRVGEEPRSLLFLNGDVSEKRLSVASADDPRVAEEIAELVESFAVLARAHGRRQHWLLVPQQARWFRIPVDRLPDISVLEERSAGGYRAYALGL